MWKLKQITTLELSIDQGDLIGSVPKNAPLLNVKGQSATILDDAMVNNLFLLT